MMTDEKQLTGADAEFGYEYGCDGLMTVASVAKFIDKSRTTVWRLVRDDKLRGGHDPDSKAAFICRRSLIEYIRSTQD